MVLYDTWYYGLRALETKNKTLKLVCLSLCLYSMCYAVPYFLSDLSLEKEEFTEYRVYMLADKGKCKCLNICTHKLYYHLISLKGPMACYFMDAYI